MPVQITPLNAVSQPDGSFYVSGVFWLTAPINNIVAVPNAHSQIPFVDGYSLSLLQSGILVEQSFTTTLFGSGTSLSDVQVFIQNMYNDAQNTLNNTNSPFAGILGSIFDGYSWQTTNPFSPTASLFNLPSHFTQKQYYWTDFKSFLFNKSGSLQYANNTTFYTIYFYDYPEAYTCQIWHNDVPLAIINSGYSQAQNDADKLDFETFYKNQGNQSISPRTPDGRPSISPNAFPSWVTLYFTGRADDHTLGVGQGARFQLSSDGYGDSVLNWVFNDSIFILGAIVLYTGAQLGDTLDYSVFAPPTTTGVGTQPVNLSNIGPGNIIVPAPPDGYSTTIDLSTAIPIPNITNTGFWNWNAPPTGLGSITPNYQQQGSYDLFDFTIPLSRPAIELPIVGDNQRLEIIIESVTSLRILPQWTHVVTMHNSGHTGLRVGWTLAGSRATSV